ncbi:MAG: helix-turn-helix domain-containing protein [Deltaproteobacteria bacterium]|nr:helix-turn-helix domain-containing protein [Deltaproteobacteria bacterium]
MARPKIHWIREPERIAAMSSPVRQAILDRIEALGPCSVADLARSLDRPADALYYHVRQLLKVGMLVEAGSRSTARRDEALFDFPHSRWHIAYDLDDPDNVAAVGKATAALLRQAGRDFDDGLQHPKAVTRGLTRNLWSLRLEARLGRDQLRAINEHLQAIIDILRDARHAKRKRGSLLSLSWVLAPLAGPARRRRSTPEETE